MIPDRSGPVVSSSHETDTERVQFETLISDISARLIAASPEQVQPAIQAALEDVRTFFQADRCILLRASADQTFANVAYAVYAEGLPPLPKDVNLIEVYPWARHKLLVERAPVIVYRMDDLPPEAAVDKATWDRISPIRSHLAVPIHEDPVVRNVVVIHWVRQECHFPDSYVPRLRVLGEMMVNALKRKQAFQDLRTSEERLDRAAAFARCGLWELDVSTGAIWVTPETREIYGLAADETTDYDLLMRLVHEADRDSLVAAIGKALGEGSQFDETYRIVCAGEAVRWIHVTGRAGDDNKLLGASVDVTDQVEAADRIRTEAARVASAIDVASLGFYEVADGAAVTYADARCRELFGFTEEGFSGVAAVEFWAAHIHPEDFPRLIELHQQLNDGRLERVSIAYRYVHPSRGVIWLEQVTHVIKRDAAGQAQTTIGVVRDVSQEKWREAALVESEELNRATFEQAAVGIAHVGIGGQWLRINDKLCAILGYSREELARMTFADVTYEADLAADLEQARQVLAGQIATYSMEKRYVRKDRSVIWVNLTASLARDAAGLPKHFISIVEDITDRKRQEEQLRQALGDVQRLRERLELENVYLRQEAKRRLGSEHIIGRGPAIRRTLALAEQVAPTDSTVLLLGETGSGKERFASYIHECSRRRDRPMIRVNCSAIPASLLESELFGREKGAYTGALSKQIGRFELAHGSTLFLDEIGELSIEVQVKLLRVLETHTIERLGNPRPVPVDVRIVAATNRNLAAAIRDGRFREDLFYRLNVFPITIPPLRERLEDIPLFVQAFMDELAAAMAKRVDDVEAASMEALLAHGWPGNVRELRNVVERAMIMATGPTLKIDAPGAVTVGQVSGIDPQAQARAQILHVLQETGWRIRGPQGAAARLGLKPSTLESRIKKLGLTRPGTAARTP